ncbi:MAG: vWA domain-containing protein [Gammaproteobacteria bacterium]|nr:vWA domain-containing protein [Gammaproteobacteria bacterium]
MKKLLLALVIVMTPLTGLAVSPVGNGDRPLLMTGKHSLYQRVLSVPGARIASEPGGQAHTAVVPFTAFYVYARREQGGSAWLELGTDRHGSRAGWLPVADCVEWNHGLTAAFRDPAGHDRVLLFKDSDSLRRLAGQSDLQAYQRLYGEALQGELSKDSPVVAIQPSGHIDIREDFYLVPIHRHEDVYLGSEKARLLQVSSVPLAGVTDSAGQRAYTAGLVFVIDSTLSMQPYIERTREAVTTIFDTLGEADLSDQVNFGLVAYRDNLDAAPGLDYLVRTYVDLDEGRDAAAFFSRLESLRDARVSSKDFTEDAYAGVKQAIEAVNWAGHDARYIVLVTDAGARNADDPLSSTGLDAEALQQMAQEKGIAVFVLHLLTAATMPDRAADAEQYRRLADFPGIGSLYYGVPTGNVEEFGKVLDALAGQITGQVRMASANQELPATVAASDNAQLTELQARVAKLGYALRMQYLQKNEGGELPSVFDAWLLDRDFRDPARTTLDVRVLLTRDQLSDLSDVLTQVLEAAEDGLLSPQNFLSELQSLAATATRDPERLGATTTTTAGAGNSLADLGFMREYIEDLPYTGEVMGLSLDDWQSWSTQQQVAFLNRLEEKVSYYRALHDHTDLWVSLDGGPVSGDSVYPVELEQLP